MRFEVARELGLAGAQEGYFGADTCVQCGKYGQILSRRAKQLLQPESSAPPAQQLPKDKPAGRGSGRTAGLATESSLDSVPKIRHNEAAKPKIRRKSKG